MLARGLTFFSIFFCTTACSSSILPFSDRYEIKKGKTVLSSHTCEDLIEKAQDQDFLLRNLAGLRASVKCSEYKFDINRLSGFELKLYSLEIQNLNKATKKQDHNEEVRYFSNQQLIQKIKSEKDPEIKFGHYKELQNRLKKSADRKKYFEVTSQMLNWALKNLSKSKISNRPKQAEILYSASQLHARNFWTADEGKKAVEGLDQSLTALKRNHPVSELLFLKARIADEAREYNTAVYYYDLTIEDMRKFPDVKTTFSLERVLWLKAWILYKEKSFVLASDAFEKLAISTSDLSEKSRALFFKAKCLKALNKISEANSILESVASSDFFGFYGLVAYRELGRKLPALSNFVPTQNLKIEDNLDNIQQPERSIFKELIRYRENILAEKAVGLIATTKYDELSLGAYLAKKSKIFLPIFRTFSKLSNDEKIEFFLRYPELIFPTPYRYQVEEISQKTNIPSSLIYSIIKQESAFNEKARSHADAMGLMQVIPRLADDLSKKFGIPYKKTEDLFDPEINIQLGSFELKEQIKKQNGQLAYVAAAYNAGPNALSGWLKTRNRNDIIEFIEEIPYEETRAYVKLIARNQVFYERISKRNEEVAFPLEYLDLVR
jgi:soluble lytic murein transglycosylase